MSVHESDREDLMREAVALVRRVEVEIPGAGGTVVCGFRRDGSLSVYFGADPVYQFDAAARLRRAFAGGLLYRTQGTTLARLTRRRTAESTELLRHDLEGGELQSFVDAMRGRLEEFLDLAAAGIARIIAQVPADDAILPDVVEVLRRHLASPEILAPAVKGKR